MRSVALHVWMQFAFFHILIGEACAFHAESGAARLLPELPPVSKYVATSFSCGNNVCEGTYVPFGENCNNCPWDCGPCQELDDAEACVDEQAYTLTFSGGPTNATVELLDILARLSVPASFFLVGQKLAQFSTVFKAEHARGHSQFSDGYSHVSLSSLTAEDCFWELQNVRSAFLELGCVNPALFRAPYHDLSPAHRDLTNRMGLRNVYYNFDTQDWLHAANDPQQVLDLQAAAVNNTFPGSIIHLQQDVDARSIALVPQMIINALSIGYKFVTMEQCLWGSLYQLHPSWVWARSTCSSTVMDWSSIGTVFAPGPCPASNWSTFSVCDSACGDGVSTSVRLTYPPTAQFSNPACFEQSFLQVKECNTGRACPSYVWRSPSGAITSADTNYTLTSPQVAAWPILAVCKFSEWRWSSSPCSSPCGTGTRMMIRDFIGAGSYTTLCGPMSRVYACNAGSCESHSLIDNIVSKLGFAVGVLCIGLLSCLPPAATHACITRWCPSRLKESKREPHPSQDILIPEPQPLQLRARSQSGSITPSYPSPWGPQIQAYPREYFMDGKAQGHFIVREPGKPKVEHIDPAHTQQVVESIMETESGRFSVASPTSSARRHSLNAQLQAMREQAPALPPPRDVASPPPIPRIFRSESALVAGMSPTSAYWLDGSTPAGPPSQSSRGSPIRITPVHRRQKRIGHQQTWRNYLHSRTNTPQFVQAEAMRPLSPADTDSSERDGNPGSVHSHSTLDSGHSGMVSKRRTKQSKGARSRSDSSGHAINKRTVTPAFSLHTDVPAKTRSGCDTCPASALTLARQKASVSDSSLQSHDQMPAKQVTFHDSAPTPLSPPPPDFHAVQRAAEADEFLI